MKFDLRELALFAEQTVTKAGDRISELRSQEKIEVNYKDAGELVTSADLLSERIIQEAIMETFQGLRILSEEDGVHNRDHFKFDGPVWVIDPLDGTVNFSRNLPHYGVSLAFALDGVVLAGAVYAPDLNCTYVGIKGEGSYCNGERLQVRRCTSLSDAVIGTGFPHDPAKVQPAIERVNRLRRSCRDIRRFAAPTVDICYVASGKLDAHTESLSPWDIAAAGLIAREAGAMSSHVQAVPDGIPDELYGEEVVFTTPGIFDDLLTLLRIESE
ncbi:inositol monophosphatase family protein [Paenibacillus typhae]|uniref:inositol monophosphatase family protein n=1 Tax=Paenibacillus typhae TaxID=1174501 RepID=UPI001C8E10D8|nr:inositol monophosphatase family protein [Paenibacillus typhae]MBY0011808.1 inositol monophosphatase [Paenibacillus typhae]